MDACLNKLHYKLLRSDRKSLGLTITNDAQLIIRAPQWMPAHQIEHLVYQKSNWILQKQEQFRKRLPVKKKEFVEGEEFLFLGNVYRLRIMDDLPKAVVLEDDLMVHSVVLRNAREHIELWYQRQAFEYIAQRTKFYAELTGLHYSSIAVNSAKTRWGSCSHGKRLHFTWRLIMAPARVVDYVVVHELMHLKQMNHSSKFWDEVKTVIPDYKIDEQWLKENGRCLIL